ncbi:aldehyde dehydrogenase family protein, partial [Staphylococcus aureus]|uniref:aldehyde dehydrogenase family protein n=1 Tax=Staphylococcus aureus TaxID=1280 RepID=UPI0035C0C811
MYKNNTESTTHRKAYWVKLAKNIEATKMMYALSTIGHKDVYDEVLEKSIKLTKELTWGNTLDNTYMGPVINKKQFDKIKNY